MLPFQLWGNQGPLVVALHWLGGSSKTFSELGDGLAESGLCCAGIDLPGFGDATDAAGLTVAETVEQVTTTIAAIRSNDSGAPWFLLGHSMGGKIAAIVARNSLNEDERVRGLRGLILVSPSPPGPEPMKESQREKLLNELGRGSRINAEKFVDANTGKFPLDQTVRERSVKDVLRADRAAFVAWLADGSKEDWSERVGLLTVPALVLAGTEEPDLGPEAQAIHTLPHLPSSALVALQGGGHLAPLERPRELMIRIKMFVEDLGYRSQNESHTLGAPFRALIDSDRTSPQTRDLLQARLTDPSRAISRGFFNVDERTTLHALGARVVPGCGLDLADCVEQALSQGSGDGWRYDSLPPDAEAWSKGLTSLDLAAVREFEVSFAALDGARQDELLIKARSGDLGKGALGFLGISKSAASLTGAEMSRWFEDVRGEFTKVYASDPRTMERIGFKGFADEHGFTEIQLTDKERTNR